MSNEQTINAGQVEILINQGRQSQSPFQLIFTQSEESADDELADWTEALMPEYVESGDQDEF